MRDMVCYWAMRNHSCAYIAIAYSNSIFCGTWTPSFCEFTEKLSKFQENEHTPDIMSSLWLLIGQLTHTIMLQVRDD